jgi:hypothetical protein
MSHQNGIAEALRNGTTDVHGLKRRILNSATLQPNAIGEILRKPGRQERISAPNSCLP